VVRPDDEVRIAVGLHQPGDFVERLVPRHTLPLVRAGGAILGISEAIRAVNEIEKPGALGTERAAVYRMIRVAFEVNDFRPGVLCLVAEAVHDDAATNGAV